MIKLLEKEVAISPGWVRMNLEVIMRIRDTRKVVRMFMEGEKVIQWLRSRILLIGSVLQITISEQGEHIIKYIHFY